MAANGRGTPGSVRANRGGACAAGEFGAKATEGQAQTCFGVNHVKASFCGNRAADQLRDVSWNFALGKVADVWKFDSLESARKPQLLPFR